MGQQQAPLPLQPHGTQVQLAPFNPLCGHVANTDISGVVTLTPCTGTADKLLIQSLDQNSYFTLDGTDPIPTGTVIGFMLPRDDPPLLIAFSENTVFKIVEEAATASLQHQWGE
jgi:hypothetical protein